MAADAQRDLDEALPALEAATASLKNLSRNDVVEVKSLSNPPAGVKLVMEVRHSCTVFASHTILILTVYLSRHLHYGVVCALIVADYVTCYNMSSCIHVSKAVCHILASLRCPSMGLALP